MDVLSIIGIVISLLIAYWQHKKAAKSDNMLSKIANELPNELISNINRLFVTKPLENEVNEINKDFQSSDARIRTQYADINNDGNDELLVQLPFSAHGSALQVYGWKEWKFTLLAELYSDTPVGFSIV